LQVVAFLQEDLLVAGGFEGDMYMFKCRQRHWQLLRAIEGEQSLCPAFQLNCSTIDLLLSMIALLPQTTCMLLMCGWQMLTSSCSIQWQKAVFCVCVSLMSHIFPCIQAPKFCLTATGDVQQSHAAHLKKQLSADFSKKLDMFKQQTASPVTNKVKLCFPHWLAH